MNKKTFVKPEAKALAMQTENLMQTGSNQTLTNDPTATAPTNIADAKRGPQSGAISATDFAWN